MAQRKSVVRTLTGSNRVRGKYDNLLDHLLHDPFMRLSYPQKSMFLCAMI